MASRHNTATPTEADIARYDNVPVELAARYIGWSTPTIYNALQQERAPFGFAVMNPRTGTWTYNISPGALVRYKNGELPTYRLKEVIDLAADGVERVVDARMEGLQKLLSAVMG